MIGNIRKIENLLFRNWGMRHLRYRIAIFICKMDGMRYPSTNRCSIYWPYTHPCYRCSRKIPQEPIECEYNYTSLAEYLFTKVMIYPPTMLQRVRVKPQLKYSSQSVVGITYQTKYITPCLKSKETIGARIKRTRTHAYTVISMRIDAWHFKTSVPRHS